MIAKLSEATGANMRQRSKPNQRELRIIGLIGFLLYGLLTSAQVLVMVVTPDGPWLRMLKTPPPTILLLPVAFCVWRALAGFVQFISG
jgi:hypothetical protein